MSVFAGVVAFDGALSQKRFEERIRTAVGGAAGERVLVARTGEALFVQQAVSSAAGKFAERAGGTLFSASARLDNREEVAAALHIPLSQLAKIDDDVLLRQTYESWGDQGIARCLGAFAFAHWNSADRRLTLGRDCLGNRPLFFYRTGDFVVFASTLKILLALPEVPRELDEIVLANFLAVNLDEPQRTFYRGIERVPSRTLITIDPSGVKHRFYWSPNFDAPPSYRRTEDCIERARELFDQAVAAATRDIAHAAISTSGGLNSSAVAATVARQGRAERITCYTLVPAAGTQIEVEPGLYLDERPKLEALRRMYPGLDLRFIAPEIPHPLVESDPHYFAMSNMPALHIKDFGLFCFLNNAVIAGGHRRLLAGYRGNHGLSWDGHFSLVALLRSGQWATFAREFVALARNNKRGLARTFASDILWRGAPVWLRRFGHRLRGRDPLGISRYSALNPDFVADHGLIAEWQQQGFDPWQFILSGNAARHRARRLFDFNQFTRDLRGWLAYERGCEHIDPHADRRVLEFALAVPEPMYRQNGVHRSLARAVFADRLPAEILNERRRGVQDVNWFRRLNVRRPTLAADIERLEASPTARRLIDLPRVKRLLAQWPADEHAAQKLDLRLVFAVIRAAHIGNFVRWVEGSNM